MGGDGRGKPWPFPGVRPVCQLPASEPGRWERVGGGGSTVWSPGWWGAAVWEPGSWVRLAPQEPGAGPELGAGGHSGQQAELAGSCGGCSLSLPTVPRVSEDWERVAARLFLGGGASDAAPLRPPGENTVPHSKGVCAPPGEDLLCRWLPFWVPRLPTHPLLFKTEVGLGTDGSSQLILVGSGKTVRAFLLVPAPPQSPASWDSHHSTLAPLPLLD